MLSFQFSFDDYEEAETAFVAFADTCRQLKETFARRMPKVEVVTGSAPTLDNLQAMAEQNTKSEAPAEQPPEPEKTTKPRTRKTSKKSEAARVSDAVNAPLEEPAAAEPPQPEAKAPAKETVTVTAPGTVTLDHIRSLVSQITTTRKRGGVLAVADTLSKHGNGATRLPELDPSVYATVYRELSKIVLDDEIPF